MTKSETFKRIKTLKSYRSHHALYISNTNTLAEEERTKEESQVCIGAVTDTDNVKNEYEVPPDRVTNINLQAALQSCL